MESKEALKAPRKFCGLLSYSPTTTGFGLRLRITRRGVAQGAGGKTAEADSACTRTNKGLRGHFPSHATCGGRRVNRARLPRASRPPLPPSLGNAESGGRAGGAAEGGNLFRAPGGGGRGARVRAPGRPSPR